MILTLEEVRKKEPEVLACGCFDVLTVGHIRHLQAARELGSLCVLVTADAFIKKPGRPIFDEDTRAEVIDWLRSVDYTVIYRHPTAVEAILALRPEVYVKGKDYLENPTMQLYQEREAIEQVGGRLAFTNGVEAHTTDTLRRLGL